jgi:YHS domain-containing protein
MKFTTRLIASATLCAVATTLSFAPSVASSMTKGKTHASAATTWPQTCVMTGTKIASAKDAVGHSTYKGKTYYFCCPMCKPQFDKDPAKYVSLAAKGKYSLSM